MTPSPFRTRLAVLLMLVMLLFVLTACSFYQLSSVTRTTTHSLTGDTIIQTKTCTLSVTSAREVRMAEVKVNKGCELDGSAKKLGVNEKMIDLMTNVVKRVP